MKQFLTGTVQYFNPEKGYGFIQASGTKQRYFFHISTVQEGVIRVNDFVSFDEAETDRGIRAINVTKL